MPGNDTISPLYISSLHAMSSTHLTNLILITSPGDVISPTGEKKSVRKQRLRAFSKVAQLRCDTSCH